MAKMGNILMVANWVSDVGYAWWLMENFWVAIAEHFETQGRTSYLIYPKITRISETIESSNIEVLECDTGIRSMANLKRLHDIIRSNRIRYVYLTDHPSYSAFYPLLRLWGVDSIVVHEHTPGERTRPRGLLRLAKRALQRTPWITADHFIAVTAYVLERFVSVSCIPAKKCSIVANGIVPIELEGADTRYARTVFGIPDNRTIIVTTGRATYYKGIDFFIDCANELVTRKNTRDLHFLFCGDGPDLDDFMTRASAYGLDEYFTFAGKRSDIRKILPSCQIGFHASTGEVGYSLSILEYMSAGLVTIVPDNPSVSGSVTDGVNGLLYRPRDIDSATNAIRSAIHGADRDTISKNAINTVLSKYRIAKTNAQLVETLDRVFN